MSENAQIIDELNKKLEEAEKADGFFVTISYRKGEVLHHYQAHINFKQDDLLPSLEEVERLIKKEVPGIRAVPKINPVRKFH